ncbi:MAG TPA: hypothetical protein VFC21_11450 [Bryobacteraceae bacterium]|nr:hypothetical protein [Bryobacteraceae bacterium]
MRIVCRIVLASFALGTVSAQDRSAAQWSPAKAASYLDSRMEWWMGWETAQREQGTFCVSCHTAAPYALGRPFLRAALNESAASADERRLIENVAKRVRLWKELAPLYPDSEKNPGKTAESRGTEAVLNALVLAANHSPDAPAALNIMWDEQLKTGDSKGAWNWLQFHNSPWEGDSQFYGAALAAVAVGYAPAAYQSSPEVQEHLRALRDYFARECGSQKLIDKVALLWASEKLSELLPTTERDAIVKETLAAQRDDGGFSLSQFVGAWKRKDNTPLETKSDGYATGMVAFVLQQTGMKPSDPPVRRALDWLRRNQEQSDGRWLAYSLNKQRDLSSDPGRFMSDAATAYAVMALESAR